MVLSLSAVLQTQLHMFMEWKFVTFDKYSILMYSLGVIWQELICNSASVVTL